jgi:hypothetical protein
MEPILKSGDAEIQCPIKGLCRQEKMYDKAFCDVFLENEGEKAGTEENKSNVKTFACSWEKSLRRRKRAPETVGGKDG